MAQRRALEVLVGHKVDADERAVGREARSEAAPQTQHAVGLDDRAHGLPRALALGRVHLQPLFDDVLRRPDRGAKDLGHDAREEVHDGLRGSRYVSRETEVPSYVRVLSYVLPSRRSACWA